MPFSALENFSHGLNRTQVIQRYVFEGFYAELKEMLVTNCLTAGVDLTNEDSVPKVSALDETHASYCEMETEIREAKNST